MREEWTDTGEIERELDDTRSRLDDTIGALQRKVAPGTMVDQAVEYFSEGGGMELGRNLGRSMRDNPIPVALIGVGLGWLLLANSRQTDGGAQGWRERRWMRDDRFGGGLDHDMYGRYRNKPSRMDQDAETSVHQPMPYEAAARDDLVTKAHQAGAELRREAGEAEDTFQDRIAAARGSVLGLTRDAGEAAAAFRERVEAAMGAAAERVRSLASGAGDTLSHFADRGQAAARDLYDHGHAAASGMRDRAGGAVGQVRDMGSRTVDYVQDQPLLLGALGITVGAVIGMLVPSTRYERRVVGSLRDSLGDTAREVAGEARQRVVRVAETVLETAQEASRREGLVGADGPKLASATRDRVADVAGRARNVVEETAAAGREAVKRELTGNGNTKTTEATNGAPGTSDQPTAGARRTGA